MKKAELKQLIRECIREVLTENQKSTFVITHTGNGGRTAYALMRLTGDPDGDNDFIGYVKDADMRGIKTAAEVIKKKFGKTVKKISRGRSDYDKPSEDVYLTTD